VPAREDPRGTSPAGRAPPGQNPAKLIVGASIQPTDASILCRSLTALLERRPGSVVECDLAALARADAAAVDALARLQLTAKRCGCSIRLRNPSAEMLALIELVGLREVLRPCAPLAVEAQRQSEHGVEALGVEEERDP
jgi:ABC-type transporter Mla MlaB component